MKYEVAVYYFPQWHPEPDTANKNNRDPNWSEWDVLKNAKPRFPGHIQPKIPLWGYTDESDPVCMEQKINAAADNGIDVFLFDWYWADGGTYLRSCLDKGFLGARNKDRLKFALMWCNHDLGVFGPGAVKIETFRSMCDDIIKNYFPLPQYWRVDGKVYFSIYQLFSFLETCGDNVETAKNELDLLRKKVFEAGLGEVHINAVDFGVRQLPEKFCKNWNEKNTLLEYLGIDSITSYVWLHHTIIPHFPDYPYSDYMETALCVEKEKSSQYKIPYHPNVSMGWDSSPRTNQDIPYEEGAYPYSPVLIDNTPQLFKKALSEIKEQIDNGFHKAPVITINSWNEWGEGSYIEPDINNGYAYLEAIRDIFGNGK